MNPLLNRGGVLLHVGCGRKSIQHTPFAAAGWREIRLDIDPSVQPDVQASMLAMSPISTGSIDALFSSHNLEHLEAHQVGQALAEFHRVLRPDGFCLMACPDLQALGQALSTDQLLTPLYESPAGPITALDILYGHRASLAAGHRHMAHRCGFTASSLRQQLAEAQFAHVATGRKTQALELWALATREAFPVEQLRELATALFYG